MSIVYLLGYEQIWEPWTYLYVFIIGYSGLVALGALVIDAYRYTLPIAGVLPKTIAVFSILSCGFGWIPAYTVIAILAAFAPTSATVIATFSILFGYLSFAYCVTPPRFRRF